VACAWALAALPAVIVQSIVDAGGGLLVGCLGAVVGAVAGCVLAFPILGVLWAFFVVPPLCAMPSLVWGAAAPHESDDPTALRRWLPWWRVRPGRGPVARALSRARASPPDAEAALPACLRAVDEFLTSGRDPREATQMLRAAEPHNRFAARLILVSSGGEVAETLLALMHEARGGRVDVIRPVLAEVCSQSQADARGRERVLLCPDCLGRPSKMRLRIPRARDLCLYGCRRCRRSRRLIEWPGPVVAVLDRAEGPERVAEGSAMRVNWPARSEVGLFDFTEVEVGAASDEDVRRFIVQVANDTDIARKGRCARMRCRVRPDARLEPTTLRQLEETFREVVWG